MSKKNDKKKKKKTVYIDDGSTVADMSALGGGRGGKRENASSKGPRPRATAREQWNTYTDAVKMMFLPMLAVLGMLAVAFLLVYILL